MYSISNAEETCNSFFYQSSCCISRFFFLISPTQIFLIHMIVICSLICPSQRAISSVVRIYDRLSSVVSIGPDLYLNQDFFLLSLLQKRAFQAMFLLTGDKSSPSFVVGGVSPFLFPSREICLQRNQEEVFVSVSVKMILRIAGFLGIWSEYALGARLRMYEFSVFGCSDFYCHILIWLDCLLQFLST